jgi:outer membrane protein
MANYVRLYKQTAFKQSRESIMKKLFTFFLASLVFSNFSQAQTPAQNLMPDGSHDMYLGLGVMSRPVYEGAAHTKAHFIPVMQMQWSNGVFLAGMSAGWHLSNQPKHEFGPIISLEPNRTSSGISDSIQTPNSFPSDLGGDLSDTAALKMFGNKLAGLEKIPTRLLYGGFYNYQITSNLRQTNTLFLGAGNNQRGIRLKSDLRYQFKNLPAHHQFSLGMGVAIVNRAYAQSYFGVNKSQTTLDTVTFTSTIWDVQTNEMISVDTISRAYVLDGTNKGFYPRAGIKDIHADIFWNWSLSSSWLVTSKVSLSQIVGSSRMSPLVERKTNMTVSSAIAYRF